ncbi:predicted protein [Histoplasma capsulatum var. duboisii H88]|uniref:Predicted protein n=1 Tax=Ajellomyces capsulatus (strain H88) TaxID=544711 RepID=F0UFT2_AJEC8|nr:predicted protein [Histoplasma capsulatum var. duboisii H88]
MPGRFGRLPSSTAVCLNEGNTQWLGLGLTSWERCGRCGRRTEANKLPKDAKYNLNSCKLSEAPVSKKLHEPSNIKEAISLSMLESIRGGLSSRQHPTLHDGCHDGYGDIGKAHLAVPASQ